MSAQCPNWSVSVPADLSCFVSQSDRQTFSSTVMIVAIAYLSYIRDVPALVAIAGCNVAMILFGWSMEAANEGRRDHPDWKHFIFGCIAGIAPWTL